MNNYGEKLNGELALAHLKAGGVCESYERLYRWAGAYLFSDDGGRSWKESSMTDEQVLSFKYWLLLGTEKGGLEK